MSKKRNASSMTKTLKFKAKNTEDYLGQAFTYAFLLAFFYPLKRSDCFDAQTRHFDTTTLPAPCYCEIWDVLHTKQSEKKNALLNLAPLSTLANNLFLFFDESYSTDNGPSEITQFLKDNTKQSDKQAKIITKKLNYLANALSATVSLSKEKGKHKITFTPLTPTPRPKNRQPSYLANPISIYLTTKSQAIYYQPLLVAKKAAPKAKATTHQAPKEKNKRSGDCLSLFFSSWFSEKKKDPAEEEQRLLGSING
jgi:hypothetical protein